MEDRLNIQQITMLMILEQYKYITQVEVDNFKANATEQDIEAAMSIYQGWNKGNGEPNFIFPKVAKIIRKYKTT